MVTLLLMVIYLSFISLGLPDSLLGSGWPVMHADLMMPLASGGIISMIISGNTIVSALLSGKILKRWKAGSVTLVSVAMTAVALLGFSFAPNFWFLCLWAIPYGLGAGCVDTALNNYVAVHFSSRHMSWLHCFWGVGASISPYIMGFQLSCGHSWRMGYAIVGILQILLVIILFLSQPLWRRMEGVPTDIDEGERSKCGIRESITIPGVVGMCIAFFCYCSLENTAGFWASSYFVQVKGIAAETAAFWASFFYLGITFGRFLSGFFSVSLGDRKMVKLGLGLVLVGVCSILAIDTVFASVAGVLLIGFGCAPVFPSLLHETPQSFSLSSSQAVMGMQMASAYLGSTFMSPFFGLVSKWTGLWFFPVYMLIFLLLMIAAIAYSHKLIDERKMRAK